MPINDWTPERPSPGEDVGTYKRKIGPLTLVVTLRAGLKGWYWWVRPFAFEPEQWEGLATPEEAAAQAEERALARAVEVVTALREADAPLEAIAQALAPPRLPKRRGPVTGRASATRPNAANRPKPKRGK